MAPKGFSWLIELLAICSALFCMHSLDNLHPPFGGVVNTAPSHILPCGLSADPLQPAELNMTVPRLMDVHFTFSAILTILTAACVILSPVDSLVSHFGLP